MLEIHPERATGQSIPSRSNVGRSCRLLALTCALTAVSGAARGDEPITPDSARRAVLLAWRSITSLDFAFDYTKATPDGKLDPARIPLHHDVAYRADATWSDEERSHYSGGGWLHQRSVQADGKDYILRWDRETGLHPQSLIIRAHSGSPYELRPTAHPLSMLLCPGQIPVANHIEAGAPVEIEGGAGGLREVIVRTKLRRTPLKITLDPEHDWLAKEVAYGDPPFSVVKVTRFARDNGRWFPVEGLYDRAEAEGKRLLLAFAVSRFRINEVSAKPIKPPKPSEGLMIEDTIKHQNYSFSTKSGLPRKKPSLPDSDPDAPGGIVVEKPRPFNWGMVVGISSGALIVLAVFLKRRSK